MNRRILSIFLVVFTLIFVGCNNCTLWERISGPAPEKASEVSLNRLIPSTQEVFLSSIGDLDGDGVEEIALLYGKTEPLQGNIGISDRPGLKYELVWHETIKHEDALLSLEGNPFLDDLKLIDFKGDKTKCVFFIGKSGVHQSPVIYIYDYKNNQGNLIFCSLDTQIDKEVTRYKIEDDNGDGRDDLTLSVLSTTSAGERIEEQVTYTCKENRFIWKK